MNSETKQQIETIEKNFPPSKKRDTLIEAIIKQIPPEQEKEPEPKIIKYFDGTDILKKQKEISEKLKEDIAEVRKQIPVVPKPPKQLTKRDIEAIVKPLIPEMPEMPKMPEIPEIPAVDLTQEREDIKALKDNQAKLEKKIEEVIITASSSAGVVSNKGGRFANKGAPDRHGYSDAGSFKSAIPDDRYLQKTGFVDDEVPTGDLDGENKTFTLAYAPSPATSLKVFINGQRLALTTDYTLSGKTLTSVYAFSAGETLTCDYRK